MDDAIAELGTGGQPILNPVPRQNSGGVMKNHLHKKGTPPFQEVKTKTLLHYHLVRKVGSIISHTSSLLN